MRRYRHHRNFHCPYRICALNSLRKQRKMVLLVRREIPHGAVAYLPRRSSLSAQKEAVRDRKRTTRFGSRVLAIAREPRTSHENYGRRSILPLTIPAGRKRKKRRLVARRRIMRWHTCAECLGARACYVRVGSRVRKHASSRAK